MSSATTSLSSSFDDDVYADVKFVNLHPDLFCVRCKQWAKDPQQLACGHRACLNCLTKLFDGVKCETSASFPCPSGEDCEPSTRDKVHPDPSAVRELKRSKVFCPYNKYGCDEKPDFAKLKEHVQSCKRVTSCPYCKQILPSLHFTEHISNVCREAPIDCEFRCDAPKMPRWKMEKEHYQDCPQKPRRCKYYTMGCNTELIKAEMLKHDEDHAVHLQMLAEHIEDLEKNARELENKLQSSRSELDGLHQRLLLLDHEKDSFRKILASCKESELSAQERNSALSSKIAQLESRMKQWELQSFKLNNDLIARCAELEKSLRQLPVALSQPAAVDLPEEVRKKFVAQDRTIKMHEMRLSEFDLRLQCAETANYEGVLIWKIGEYVERKKQAQEGRVLSLYSQPFYTSRYGYKMCARVYLNGDGLGKNTHLSLFFVVMQGDYDEILTWPFRQRVTLNLLDQVNNRRTVSDSFRPDPSSSSFLKPTSPMNVASGCPMFVPHQVLESDSEPYLRNDTIFIKVVVDTSDLLPP